MKLCFVSSNAHKIREIQEILSTKYHIIGLADLGFQEDIPENEPTFEGNSLYKAKFIWEKYNIDCFSDDSGLEVKALQGAPGVYSARYAGPQKNDEDNIRLLLENLKGQSQREAQFRTCITLVLQGEIYQFEGIVKGYILTEKRGEQGFGYDPIFIPEGYQKTFAQMSAQQKNSISHRALALQKLATFLADR